MVVAGGWGRQLQPKNGDVLWVLFFFFSIFLISFWHLFRIFSGVVVIFSIQKVPLCGHLLKGGKCLAEYFDSLAPKSFPQ